MCHSASQSCRLIEELQFAAKEKTSPLGWVNYNLSAGPSVNCERIQAGIDSRAGDFCASWRKCAG